jgi:Smg protein
MFEVLVFVYENYWRGDACPEPEQLGRKLSAHGFDPDEIHEALQWLDGLSLATQGVPLARLPDDEGDAATAIVLGPQEPPLAASPGAMRVYSALEQDHLGADCLGFLSFLESSGRLPAGMREIVIDRAMAAPWRAGLAGRVQDHHPDGPLEHRHRARCPGARRTLRRHLRARRALSGAAPARQAGTSTGGRAKPRGPRA